MEFVIDYPDVLLAGMLMAVLGLLWHQGLFMREWLKETGRTIVFFKEEKLFFFRSVIFSLLVSLLSALGLALLLGLTRPEGFVGVFLLTTIVFMGFVILLELHRVLFEKRAWSNFFISSAKYALMLYAGALTLMYL